MVRIFTPSRPHLQPAADAGAAQCYHIAARDIGHPPVAPTCRAQAADLGRALALHRHSRGAPSQVGRGFIGMRVGSTAWRWLRAQARSHHVELRLALRATVSSVLTLIVSQTLGLPLPLWGVLTSVILTQLSIGRSLKATINYLIGTVGGAIYAGAVGALVPHETTAGLMVVVAVAIAPVTFLAAVNPRFSAAPFTAVMVVLAPTLIHLGPLASAWDRIVEVTLGGVVGLIVSFLVFPARAHSLTIESAARMLDLIAGLLPALLKGFTGGIDEDEIRGMQDAIGQALGQLFAVGAEAEHERMTRLGTQLDQGPLLRTLLRLRHDLVMIGRAAAAPLPEPVRSRLGPILAHVGEAAVAYLRASGAALVGRRAPPPRAGVEAALDEYAAAIAAVRREGLTRGLPDDAVERMFALGFVLEEVRQHLADLDRFTGELTQTA
jgi:uncharacterized membrane protein YccC